MDRATGMFPCRNNGRRHRTTTSTTFFFSFCWGKSIPFYFKVQARDHDKFVRNNETRPQSATTVDFIDRKLAGRERRGRRKRRTPGYISWRIYMHACLFIALDAICERLPPVPFWYPAQAHQLLTC